MMAEDKGDFVDLDTDPAVAAVLEQSGRRFKQRGAPERKRRRDATGRKADYHQGTSTLTVRLPNGVVEQVKRTASEQGKSANAWLREAVLKHLQT